MPDSSGSYFYDLMRARIGSEQLVAFATSEYVAGRIEVDELEDRVHRALAGDATDDEWITAARSKRDAPSLANVDSILKRAYSGPIR